MKTYQTYYPYDRLALVVDENNYRVLQLVWLTSRWGVYSYSGNKWNEEITKQFHTKGRLYAHLDSENFWEILAKFNELMDSASLEDFKEYQVTYEFEYHELFDMSLSEDGLRDPYEISRWVNEFSEPSPVEREGETCDRSKYYGHFVAEIVEPEERRRAYEAEILRRRNTSIEERVQQKLSWIEGLPALNHYAADIYNHAYDRHKLQEIGQEDFEERPDPAIPNFSRLYWMQKNDPKMTEEEKIEAAKVRLARSLAEKHKYFNEHGVSKEKGFELHHVVALAWAESEHHFKLLDNWKNMVYIDGYNHAKITQNRNLNVQLSVIESDIALEDYSKNRIDFFYKKNIIWDPSKASIIQSYNKELLDFVTVK